MPTENPPGVRPKTAPNPPAKPPPPLVVECDGDLRGRVERYAQSRARSLANAGRWAMHLGLKQEGF